VAAAPELVPLPRRRSVQPEPAARELLRAAELVRGAVQPVALAGNGVIRAKAAPALREFVRATGIPVAETFMGKGLLPPDNATGNFTKVVQRIPVRIRVPANVGAEEVLRPGMSVVVTVDTKPGAKTRGATTALLEK